MEAYKIEYTVKNDIIFRFLFSDKEVLKNFLEVVLGKDINDVEVVNQFSLNTIKYEEKVGILDIKANINDEEIVDLEMQRSAKSNYQKRILLYAGNLISKQLKSGNDYIDLKGVTAISILDYVVFPEIDKVHTVWSLREEDYIEHEPLGGLVMHFIELPKFRKSNPNFENKLNQWLALIDTGNKEWLEEAMESNDKIRDAKSKVDNFMSDDEARTIIELREKWRMDYNASIDYAEKSGLEQGIKKGMKKGIKEGIREGKKVGIKEGKKEGKKEANLEMAKKLIKLGLDTEKIVEVTSLSFEEINKLK